MRHDILALALAAAAATFVARGARGMPGPPETAPPPPTGDLRVTVTVLGSDRTAAPAAQAIVWLPDTAARAKPGGTLANPPRVASKGKRFDPRVTAVPAGTTVEFPNLDRIFHNVFSLSPNATFDLGLYRNGASRAMTFDRPGLVRVYCNIHPQMAAYLLVIDGTIWAQTGPDGGALLTRVPAGRVALRAWDEKGGDYQGSVDVAPGKTATLQITLDGSTFKDAPHTNKYGKKYPPPDDDANRY